MVGSAICREARIEGHEVSGKSSIDLDLTNRELVFKEITSIRPQCLIIAAAKVGGIGANSAYPVEFLSENLQIQTNLLDAANEAQIERVVFLGSSCVYPKFAKQPISEESLLTGALEKTNEPYAVAKIAGLKLVEAYRKQEHRRWISLMPTNLYGPRDNFNLTNAHVLPALVHKFHLAKVMGEKETEIWGDGSPLREFLHVDDLAKACLIAMDGYDGDSPINVGSGDEISISDLAKMISSTVGYEGEIIFNSRYPNGTPRKVLDSQKIRNLGWHPQVSLINGIAATYDWFLRNQYRS